MLARLDRILVAFLFASGSCAFFHFEDLTTRQPDVIKCLTAAKTPFVTDTSSNWSTLSVDYNLRVAWNPAVITLPVSTTDVRNSVKCAAAAGLKVQPKSGGHSYGAYSLGGQNGSLIVDLGNMNSVTLDRSTGIATVGGGVRLGNLAIAIHEMGNRALPHGACPGVGVGGHFTHGGHGYASRLWGLSLDTIVALDVVLANGSLIHTTAAQYPDIFYAMRGAADSFGIAVYFYLQTRPEPSKVVNFWANVPGVLSNVSTATAGFLKLQETVLDASFADPRLSFGIYLDSKGFFNISGICIDCNLEMFNNVTFPRILNGLPKSSGQLSLYLDWITTLEDLANGTSLPLDTTAGSYKLHDTTYAKSITTKNEIPLSKTELDSYFGFVLEEGSKSPTPWFSLIDWYGGPHSAINAPSPDSSAYSNRDMLWVFMHYGFTINSQPPFPDTMKTFIANLTDSLTKFFPRNFGIYLNYQDPDLTPTEWALVGYGAKTYNKLLYIKKLVDPHFVFWNPQAVGIAPELPTNGYKD